MSSELEIAFQAGFEKEAQNDSVGREMVSGAVEGAPAGGIVGGGLGATTGGTIGAIANSSTVADDLFGKSLKNLPPRLRNTLAPALIGAGLGTAGGASVGAGIGAAVNPLRSKRNN